MDLKKLQAPLERQLGLLGFELVMLESAKEGRDTLLRLYIDHLDSESSGRRMTLDDCVRANEGLLAWMDVEFPDLREETGIEISSPGIERPLTKADHFRRYQGHLCRLQTRTPVNGQRRCRAGSSECNGETVTIEEDGALKPVPLEALQKARLAPFDEEKTPKPKHLQARLTDFSAPPAPTPAEVETSLDADLTQEV